MNQKIQTIKKFYIYLCIIILFILGSSFFFIQAAFTSPAFTPQINYQGRLTTPAGIAVSDGRYNMRFRLCTDSVCTAAAVIWTETHCFSPDGGITCPGTGTDQRIPVTSGLFSVLLGSISSVAAVNFNQGLWLEVQVGGLGVTPTWEILTPRKRLGAVPAAFEAGRLSGFTWASPGAIGTITPTTGAFTTLTASLTGDALTLSGVGANIFFSGAGLAQIRTATGQHLALMPGGNVGIGITTPAHRLDVVGTGRISGLLTLGTQATGVDHAVRADRILTAGAGLTGGGNLIADRIFDIGAGTGISVAADSIAVIYGATAGTAVEGNRTITITPGTNLSGGGMITLGAGGTLTLATIPNPVFTTSVTTPLLTNTGPLTLQTTATAVADDLIFQTAGVERMRILEGGFVGIGTTTPVARLEVVGGSIRLGGGGHQVGFTEFDFSLFDASRGRPILHRTWSATDGDFLNLNNVQAGGAAVDDWIRLGQHTGIIFATDGAERIRITPVGNVGIGTTAPTRRLDVAGRLLVREGVFPHDWATADWGATVSLRRPGPVNMGAASHGNAQLEISSAGRDVPFIAFHAPGHWGANFGLDTDNWFSTRGWSAGAGGYTGMRVGSFRAVGNAFIDGNVGIGTTAPAERLHVVGNIRGTGNLSVDGTVTASVVGGVYRNSKVFTASGTFVPPFGVTTVYVQMVGGGAGGGAGGAGGRYVAGICPVTPGVGVTVTVGAGGAGGTHGGSSSFGACLATGATNESAPVGSRERIMFLEQSGGISGNRWGREGRRGSSYCWCDGGWPRCSCVTSTSGEVAGGGGGAGDPGCWVVCAHGDCFCPGAPHAAGGRGEVIVRW